MANVIEKAQSLADKYLVEQTVFEKRLIQIDANNSHSFSFSLRIDGSENTLVFGRWHQSFENQEEALLLFEKCLSGEARVRDVTSLGIPYKGVLEIYEGDSEKPKTQYIHGMLSILFLFPFPKKEKVYRNSFTKTN